MATSSSTELTNLFKFLPAAATTVWVMATPYFNRPYGETCSTGLKIGLGVISGVLGIVCWLRTAIAMYSSRCVRRQCNRGFLWFLIAVVEGGAVTALFAAIALLTPPGSTCFFPGDGITGTSLSDFMIYTILGGATLLAFAIPRLLGWMMTLAELFGVRVRPAPGCELAACAARGGGVDAAHAPLVSDNALYGVPPSPAAGAGPSSPAGEVLMDGKGQPMERLAEPPAAAAGVPVPAQKPGAVRALLDNDRLQWYVWQFLPAGTVTLYQVVTAYYATYAADGCTGEERAWLIVLISLVGAAGFFVTLESYEKDCPSSPSTLLFRTRGVDYRLGALAASAITAGAFAGVALLTPPAAPCFFAQRFANDDIQVIGTAVLPGTCAAMLAAAGLRAVLHRRRVQHQPLAAAGKAPVYASSPTAAGDDAANQQQFMSV